MSQLPRLTGSIREQNARNKQAYDEGNRNFLAVKKSLAKELARPAAMPESGAAVLDGLMEIYQRKGQVVLAIKELAITTKEATTTLDIYA